MDGADGDRETREPLRERLGRYRRPEGPPTDPGRDDRAVRQGDASYNAWTEILPQSETLIPGFTVRPGDVITVDITKGSGKAWTMVVTELPTLAARRTT